MGVHHTHGLSFFAIVGGKVQPGPCPICGETYFQQINFSLPATLEDIEQARAMLDTLQASLLKQSRVVDAGPSIEVEASQGRQIARIPGNYSAPIFGKPDLHQDG